MAQSPDLREQIALARQEVARRRQQSPPTMREQIALARQEVARRRAQPSEPSWYEQAIPMGLRIGGAIGGGVVGAVGGPAGVIAGGAAGAGLGEAAAQRYEQGTGQRESYNLPQIGVQAVLGSIPMGRAFGSTGLRVMAGRGAQGGIMGAGATAATSLAETGELPSLRDVAVGTGLGTVLGGGMGAGEARAFRRAWQEGRDVSLASVARPAREAVRQPDKAFKEWYQRRAPRPPKVEPPVPAQELEAFSTMFDDITPKAGVVAPIELPAALGKAKPRFNIGRNAYLPVFDDPLDMAAFIISQKNPSPRNAAYLKVVMDRTGLSRQAAEAKGRTLRDEIKRIAQQTVGGTQQKPTPITIPQVTARLRGAVPEAGMVSPLVPARVGGAAVGATPPVTPPTPGAAGVVSPSGLSGKPIADPMAGFDPFIQKFTNPLVRAGIKEVLELNQGYVSQRRGRIDTETLGKFANMVTINASRVLPKGTALNAEQITAYARGLQQTTRKVNRLSAIINSGVENADSSTNLLTLQAARAEQDVLAASLTGARAEAGRALAAFNFYQGVLDTADQNLIAKVVDGPGMRGQAQRIARELAKLPEDPMLRYRWLQKQKQSSIMDKVRSYYYANILSGVKTHERNFFGNVANIASTLVVHPMAAGIDAATSAVTGSPRTIRVDEIPAQALGAFAGLERGIRDFAFTLKEGVSPDALSRSLHTGELGKLDIPRVEFTGGLANPFNLPGRFLDASDTLFRSVAKNMELYGLASTAAKNEGLTGQAFIDRVATLRLATTREGIALRDQAHLFARRTVFQEDPGEMVKGIQGLARLFPPLTFLMPFIKTPANILRQGIEFSPLGALMPAVRQGGRAGAQAQARVAAGTAAAGVLAYLASTGRLSGRGPRSTAERNALYEKGWEPNSVKIGDTWVSYQLFQPVSVQAAIIANVYEALKEAKADDATMATGLSDAIGRSINSFLNQSFLSGLFDFVEAIQGGGSFSRVAGRTASGFVPLVSLQRQIAQGMDPVIRQPRTMEQTVLTSIPGLSKSVPPRLTRFGEEVVRPGGPVKRMLDPFNLSTEVDDPVANELSRLGVSISVPSGRLTMPVELQDRTGLEKFPLSDAQMTQFRQAQGRAVRRQLERVMQSPEYRSMSDVGRERLIRSARTRVAGAVREQARRQLLLGARTPDMAGTPRGVGKQFTSGPFAGQTWTVVDGTPQRVN